MQIFFFCRTKYGFYAAKERQGNGGPDFVRPHEKGGLQLRKLCKLFACEVAFFVKYAIII